MSTLTLTPPSAFRSKANRWFSPYSSSSRPRALGMPIPERGPRSRSLGARAVVGHAELEPAVRPARTDHHAAARRPRADGVLERVLHQRLQQERRHRRVVQPGRDVPAHLEPVAEAGLLDLQIEPQESQLLLQRRLLPVAVEQRHPQEIGELHDHPSRRGGIVADQHGDRVEGVEEKVRLELRLQGAELGLGQLRLESRHGDLALAQGGEVLVHAGPSSG